jgi:sugar (pentulose or hexulose) kinase
MEEPLFIGIDIGTTSVKAGVFDIRGTCLGNAGSDYALQTPLVNHVELDAEIYWQAVCDVTRKAHLKLGENARSIAAITISSQGETTIAVDRKGKPLYPAMVWLDKRSHEEARQLSDKLGNQVYAHTGIPEINPTWTACKIEWLRTHRPDIFAATYKFLLVQDFIVHRLCEEYVTDGAISCTSMLYDIVQHQWWQASLEAVGIDPDKLSRIAKPGEVAGILTSQAAQNLDLPAGIPIVLGGMDQAVGAVGVGNLSPEIVSETTGGALAIQAVIPRPDLDVTNRIPVYVHSQSGQYLFVPVCDTGGMAFKWFRDNFGTSELRKASLEGLDAYDLLTQEAEAVEPGSNGLLMLPHLTGAFSPEYNPYARGVFYGFTLYHHKAHFTRAVLEAIAYMLRRNLELIGKAGVHPRQICSTGGGARSMLWKQIKADVCNLPVITPRYEDSAVLGDTMLGAVAVGVFENLEQASQEMVSFGERLMPNPENVVIYERSYQAYSDLYERLDPLFRHHFGGGENGKRK